jgi:acetyl-CoA acetyltransferase
VIESVVLAGARTPLGRPFGCLRALSAAQFGTVAVRAALERARVRGDEVDQVLLGHSAADAGDDRPARAAVAGAGIPPKVPLLGTGQLSLSGLNAIAVADRLIRSGTSDIVVAGGLESMSVSRRDPDERTTPRFRLPRSRPPKPDRRTRDEVAALSHERGDGAAAVVMMRRSLAEERGLDWLAEVVGHGAVSGRTDALRPRSSLAIREALAPLGLKVRDLDLIEVDESFAAVAVRAMSVLCTRRNRINPHGGAIAPGHPAGTSGARVVLHLAHSLRRRGGGLGAAGVRGGAGLGEALLLRSSRR